MPLDKEAMREYQRKRRAKARGVPDEEPVTGEYHEHYWRRAPGDDFATCTEFEFQRKLIGGCGEVQKYEGKLLSTGAPDLALAIIDSPYFKEIFGRLPVKSGG